MCSCTTLDSVFAFEVAESDFGQLLAEAPDILLACSTSEDPVLRGRRSIK